MRTLSFIVISATLISASAGNIQAQVRDSARRAGVEDVLGSLERSEMGNDSRVWSGERDAEARERGRGSDDRYKYDSKHDRRERERAEARWRWSQERELRSCERDLWGRVRRERDRWDDDRYVRSTRERIRRVCERQVYGRGAGWGWRIRDRLGR
jgi:hypothetical protein